MTIVVAYQISASLIAFCIWIMEGFLDGRKEAYYAAKAKEHQDKPDYNIYDGIMNSILSEKRWLYLTTRLVMTYLLVIGIKITVLLKYEEVSYHPLISAIVFITILLAPVLSYPFIHDATFYTMMNRRIPGYYPRSWKTNLDQSRFSVNYPTRLYLFIIAVLMLVSQIIIHVHCS